MKQRMLFRILVVSLVFTAGIVAGCKTTSVSDAESLTTSPAVALPPRTRTRSGVDSPTFPYAQPEDVGLSSERLDQLGLWAGEAASTGNSEAAQLLLNIQ